VTILSPKEMIMGEFLTVTMTDHRPVRIKKDDWQIIADAKRHNEDGYKFWEIKVRQSLNTNKFLVHAIYDNNHPEFPDEIRHGFLVDDVDELPQKINKLCELIKADPRLAHNCISNLPSVHLQ
jgi:hypothetical protein